MEIASAIMVLWLATLLACANVFGQTGSSETTLRMSSTGFLRHWRVPFQVKVALNKVNQAPGEDHSLFDLVSTANGTDDARLTALGLTGAQQDWAKQFQPLLEPVSDGAVLGLRECHRRFKYERWNCPMHKPEVLQKVFMIGGREASFVYGIQAAGIALAVARTCSKGNTDHACGCDEVWQEGGSSAAQPNSSWSWSACSDNMHFAYEQTVRFLTAGRQNAERAPQDMVEQHGYRMGLEVSKEKMQFLCKCHGLTGSCVHRTCWYSVSKIQVIGRALMRRHSKSQQVRPDPSSGRLVPENGERRVAVKDSVHIHQSPDYCERNVSVGSLGTAGRECGRRQVKQKICPTLCCGRGSIPRRVVVHRQCECRFEWCCRVRCNECEDVVETWACE